MAVGVISVNQPEPHAYPPHRYNYELREQIMMRERILINEVKRTRINIRNRIMYRTGQWKRRIAFKSKYFI